MSQSRLHGVCLRWRVPAWTHPAAGLLESSLTAREGWGPQVPRPRFSSVAKALERAVTSGRRAGTRQVQGVLRVEHRCEHAAGESGGHPCGGPRP